MKFRWIWILAVVLLADAGLFRVWFRWRRWHSQDSTIAEAAQRYHVDPALVKAVIWKESQFDPSVRGRAGEVGLMQVRELTAREWAEAERKPFRRLDDLLEPSANTLAGTWYLNKLLRRYAAADNPVPYALADYNAGRRNVLRWTQGASATNSTLFLEQIDFPTTRSYVAEVVRQYAHFQGQWKR